MEFLFDVRRVQTRLLEMAKKIAQILESENIPYQIAFGTLLGAVRHKGFIPWDDDFDFFLFDETYEKAMDVLFKNLPHDMFLENEKTEKNYFHAWAHVKDLNSECTYEHYPQDSLYKHQGISVDLYRIKKIQAKDFANFRYEMALQYIERRKQLGFISEEEFVNRKKTFEIRKQKDVLDIDKEILAYPFDIGHQFTEDVFPLKKYKFENETFFGPNNADHILKMRYGNYMELPKEEDRIPHYSNVIFK